MWTINPAIILSLAHSVAPLLYCYVCDDCPSSLSPLRHMAACPDSSHVSCITTLTTFAEFKTISRGCSKAPALARRGHYNRHRGAVCSQHTVNIMRATVCLCDRDTCNGPSLPPQEMLEEDADQIIDIEEVIREMNSEPKEPEPEAVSGAGGFHSVFLSALTLVLIQLLIHRLALRLGC